MTTSLGATAGDARPPPAAKAPPGGQSPVEPAKRAATPITLAALPAIRRSS